MAINKQKVIDIALAEIGYLEKKSNSNLDSDTANAGSKNWTKYARDLDAIPGFYNGKKNGYAWCDAFVDWCFVQAYGVAMAKKLLGQPDKSLGASCTYSMRYYKSMGRLFNSPKVGDQIFFGSGSSASHTGLVYKVDGSKVYTVEGNTSGASGVVANGGGVFAKSYALNYTKIAGYGRPAYDDEADQPKEVKVTTGNIDTVKEVQVWLNNNYSSGLVLDGLYGTLTRKALVKALQKELGVDVDGIFGRNTRSAVKTLRKGDKGILVKILQGFLVCYGYKEAYMDGDFGSGTETAVRAVQKRYKIEVDGIAGKDTFTALCS